MCWVITRRISGQAWWWPTSLSVGRERDAVLTQKVWSGGKSALVVSSVVDVHFERQCEWEVAESHRKVPKENGDTQEMWGKVLSTPWCGLVTWIYKHRGMRTSERHFSSGSPRTDMRVVSSTNDFTFWAGIPPFIYLDNKGRRIHQGVRSCLSESSLCWGPGVGNAAPAGPARTPARRQECEIEAAKPSKRQEVEAGDGPFGVAWAVQHDALFPGKQVPVTVDVHVRPRRRAFSQLPFRTLWKFRSAKQSRKVCHPSVIRKWRRFLMLPSSFLCQRFFWGISVPQVDLQRSVSYHQLSEPAGRGRGRSPGGYSHILSYAGPPPVS